MNASRTLSNSFFLMVAWSALMLSLAEGALVPVPLSLPIVFVAWVLERQQALRCPPWLAFLLGLGAFGVSIVEFTLGDIESRLLSIAHVVVYLTWIVLFMKKGPREYWLLLALSLLQVAVGAVLTIEGWYGAMLSVSLLLMLWTLAVFTFHRAHTEYGTVAMVTGNTNRRGTSNPFELAGATSGASQIDAGETWLGRRFRKTLLKTLVATGLLAGVVFASVPRIWIGNPIADVALKAVREKSVALTGFTDTVRLGEMGTILESDEPVLQVRLFDQESGERISMDQFAAARGMDEPLFRGTVMSGYRDGEWSKAEAEYFDAIELAHGNTSGGAVRQEFTLEPTSTRLLFVLAPYLAIAIEDERMPARVGLETGAIHYPRGRRYAPRYNVISPAPHARGRRDWWRVPAGVNGGRSALFQWMLRTYSRVPAELTQLRALAATVAEPITGIESPPAIQAERISRYLNNSELFKYSLTAVRSDKNLDPIEDFLANHRTGNCEYFATAMTLMLRVQRIPARLVTGFKGGYTNGIDGTFEVQKMHAHTWVEAFIGNRWVTFDPTPVARSETVAAMEPGMRSLTDVKMWLNGLWSRLIVNMSLEEQKAKLYDPMAQQFRTFAKSITGRGADGWKSALSVRTWLTVPGIAVGLAVLAAVLFPFRKTLWQRLRRLLRRGDDARAQTQREHPSVRFYEEFRSICSVHGQTRSPSQTDREFAEQIQGEWADRLIPSGLHELPGRLTEQFYKVRYGDTSVDHLDVPAIEGQLAELAERLRVTAAVR